MKITKFILTFAAALLLPSGKMLAKEVIKEVNIVCNLPETGVKTRGASWVTSVTTNLYGGREMLNKGEIESKTAIMFYTKDFDGRLTSASLDVVQPGMTYYLHGVIKNYTEALFNNVLKNGNYQTTNSLVKLTVNGKPAKILEGSAGRTILFEIVFNAPGNLDPIFTNISVSSADGNVNGYGYVDLGLPSGTRWATCNLGAKQPEGYGDFYAFGETKAKKLFTDKNFCGYGSFAFQSGKNFAREDSIYLDPTKKKGILNRTKDAASQNMGADWRIPSRTECKELFQNTYSRYVKHNGIAGVLLTSKINGKSIFIPFNGWKNEYLEWQQQGIIGRGYSACLWSNHAIRIIPPNSNCWGSTYDVDDITGFSNFKCHYGGFNEGDNHCAVGMGIRAVCGGDPNVDAKPAKQPNSKPAKQKRKTRK